MGEHLPDIRADYKSLYLAQYNGAFELMHDLDLAMWYAAQPVKKIHCVYGTYSDIGIQSPDVAEFLLDFEDRRVATVHLDFFQRPRRRQMELIGTKGTITVEFARWDHCTVTIFEASRGEWSALEMATDRNDMFRAEDREFLEAVAEDKPIHCTIAEGRKSLEAVLTAQRANNS
jgi:predicted dehydrogenase